MKIWFEALTGKQSLLFHHIAQALEERGHTSLFTTRDYDFAYSNLSRLGRSFQVVGKYGGASLKDKLIAGSKRIIELAEIVDEFKPDLLISFPSPDAHRTAFGMGIPIIQLNDTPHAEAVARLTISLTDALVYPAIIAEEEFRKYGVTRFIPYHGVDEALWIKNFQPDKSVLEKLGLEPYKYVVLRCEESKAAYFQKLYPEVAPGSTIVVDLVDQLEKQGIDIKIVAFPRYPEQYQILGQKDVILPEQSIDTLSLLYYAGVAMTGGGTMGREAALLGTPTIYTFPRELKVSTFVSNMGFPLLHFTDLKAVPDKIISLLGQARMEEEIRNSILKKIETPLVGVDRAIELLEDKLP